VGKVSEREDGLRVGYFFKKKLPYIS
jgi:hypothetical protein